MASPATEIGYAKINLALHVRQRRADGYHDLETLFAFADDGDVLTAEPADDFSMQITGPFAAGLSQGADNLVLRAVTMLAEANDISQPLRFTLNKRLPVAAGIGGGSADAAAALRLAERLWDGAPLRVPPTLIAPAIGADVPACLVSQSCFGQGVGADLSPLPDAGLTGLPILLVNPGLACPTGPIFQAWDGIDRGPLIPADWQHGRNDLEAPAVRLIPEIQTVLDVLVRQAGVRLARMSGSGATCFALFDSPDQRDRAAERIQHSHAHWWTMATRLR